MNTTQILKGCGEHGKFDGRGYWTCGLTRTDDGVFLCKNCESIFKSTHTRLRRGD